MIDISLLWIYFERNLRGVHFGFGIFLVTAPRLGTRSLFAIHFSGEFLALQICFLEIVNGYSLEPLKKSMVRILKIWK